jgi:DNA-binding cell septation regulator SpoVG
MVDATFSADVDRELHDLTVVVNAKNLLGAFPKRLRKEDSYKDLEFYIKKHALTVTFRNTVTEVARAIAHEMKKLRIVRSIKAFK